MQYTPGAESPSALAKIDMLQMLQRTGKPVYVCCPVHEVAGVIDKLDPKGLAISATDVASPKQTDGFMQLIQKRFGKAVAD